MELRHLRYFVMAAEEGSISRAASRLNVSQPAVSRQVRDLESEWGTPLFQRLPQGLRLTPAGEIALSQAKVILRELRALSETMRSFSLSRHKILLNIGFIPTALPGLLAEALKLYQQRHPNTCAQIFEMHPSEQIAALRRGDIDLALPGAISRKIKAYFFTRRLRTTPLGLAMPSDHPLAQPRPADLAAFVDNTFITLDEGRFPGREQLQQRLFQLVGISPKVGLHAPGLNELLGLVGSGAGVALVPTDLDRINPGNVAILKLRRPAMSFSFSAVWCDSDRRSAVETFVSVLAEVGSEWSSCARVTTAGDSRGHHG